jgi:hypothetical protein
MDCDLFFYSIIWEEVSYIFFLNLQSTFENKTIKANNQ